MFHPDFAENVGAERLLASLGVRRVIHAGGTKSAFGGTLLAREVREVMKGSNTLFCDLDELNEAIGRRIASATGAEAGLVTNGAASAVVLAATAIMNLKSAPLSGAVQIPTVREFVVQRAHRGQYNFLITVAGGCIREVGSPGSCDVEEMETALSHATAGIYYLCGPRVEQTTATLPRVSALARRNGVPLLVNAAAMLPPRSNLQRFIREGADIVAMSGGKIIGGPQDSGLLFGRRTWVDRARSYSSPHLSFGRAQKMSKEDMLGFAVAFDRYLTLDEDAFIDRMAERVKQIQDRIVPPPGVLLSCRHDAFEYFVPTLVVEFGDAWPSTKTADLVRKLLQRDPPVFVRHLASPARLEINPVSLLDGEEVLVAEAVSAVIQTESTKLNNG